MSLAGKVFVSALWLGGLSYAQITGTLTGVVEDPTGARVAGAAIVALNHDTSVRYSATSTDAGVYVIPQLPLGDYTITVEAAGFKISRRNDVALGSDARLRVDVRLELGGATETVTVSAAPPLVESERATLGGSFTAEIFDRLPIGRDPMAVLQLVPGSLPSQGGFATGVFNGAHEETTDYKVDGAAATMTSNYRAPQPPIEEMVEEVVLQSGNYSAEYGHGSSQLSINTRAGTNAFHGTAFEYFQNEDLNANGFFNNLRGNGQAVNRQNLFGVTLGGPLLVPKLYNGRNRTFFNFGFQGTRSQNNSQYISTVPSAAMRAGDFSGPTTIYDPATTAGQGSNATRNPFPGNMIPANRFDPVAVNILANSFPLPNGSGAANNYSATGPSPLSNTSFNARVDQNFSANNRLTARYSRWYQTVFNFDRWPGPSGAPTNNNVQNNDRQSTIISLEHTYIVRANMVNTVRFGHFIQRENLFGPGTDEDWASRLGLKNAGPEKFPLVSISGLTGFGGGNLSRALPGDNDQLSDTVLLIKGRHHAPRPELHPGELFGKLHVQHAADAEPGHATAGCGIRQLPAGHSEHERPIGLPRRPLADPVSILLHLRAGRSSRQQAADAESRTALGSEHALHRRAQSHVEFQSRHRPDGPGRAIRISDHALRSVLQKLPAAGWLRVFAVRQHSHRSPRGLRDFLPGIQCARWRVAFYDWAVGPEPVVSIPGQRHHLPDHARRRLPGGQSGRPAGPQLFELGQYGCPSLHAGLHAAGEFQHPAAGGRPHAGTDRLRRQQGQPFAERPAAQPSAGEPSGSGECAGAPALSERGSDSRWRRFHSDRHSTYHAFQAQMQKRLQHGVWAQAAYTFSKTIDDFQGNGSFGSFAATSVQDNYNIRAEKSAAIFSEPHVLTRAFLWELPVGKGRSLVHALAGGWNLSSIASLQSGMPLVMGTFQNQTGALSGGSRPNRVGNPLLPGDKRGIYGWFDPSVFTLPAPFAFGSDSRTEPQLLQPGAFNMSAMLQKEFRFSEKRWFEFRCQSGNILNHFNPGGPATTIGAPGVGAITGRSLQLALKLHY